MNMGASGENRGLRDVHQETVEVFMKNRHWQEIISGASAFNGPDQKKILHFLLATGEAEKMNLPNSSYNFTHLSHEEIVQALLNAGQEKAVAEGLQYLRNLSGEVADRLLDCGYVKEVVWHVENFKSFTEKAAAIFAQNIDSCAMFFSKNLEKFPSFNAETADILLKKPHNASFVADNLERFHGIDFTLVAQRLLSHEWTSTAVARNLEKFHGVDHAMVISRLLELHKEKDIADNLEKFTPGSVDQLDLMKRLFKERQLPVASFLASDCIAKNAKKFTELSHESIARNLMKTGGARSVATYWEGIPGIREQEVANILLQKKDERGLGDTLKNFHELNPETAHRLCAAGQGYIVTNNLEKFPDIDTSDFANRLIAAGQEWSVARNLEKFPGIDQQKLIEILKKKGNEHTLVENIGKFKNINHQEIVDMLFERGEGHVVAENIEKFQGVSHQEIADRLLKAHGGVHIHWTNWKKHFKNLDPETQRRIDI
ncbi:MAG: hypothetical protein QX199_04440 [Methylococcaceae bacterium]